MAPRFLVVDDEASFLALIKSMLKPLGFEVVALEDSREADRRQQTEKFDGIFVDARMPYLDGFELCKRIRGSPLNHNALIVMLTGADDVDTMRRGFQAGVTFFVGKPFTAEKLHTLLRAGHGAMLREKRRYARLPLRSTVSCTVGERQFTFASLNISEGGMSLATAGELEPGQEVDLRFTVPHSQQQLRARAKVKRLEAPDRAGVEFFEISPEDQETIQSYIMGIVKD